MEGKEGKKSGISKVGWFILLGLTIIIDIVQIILDFFAIGIIVNRIIDIVVGFCLPLYFWIKGISLTNWKRLAAITGGFVLEAIPGLDALPLWSAEVAVVWGTVVAENKISNIPVLGKAYNMVNNLNNKQGIRQPNNQRSPVNTTPGVRLPRNN